jgi:hypothetical protein
VKVTGSLAAGTLQGTFTLKLPRKTTLDPAATGVQVTFGAAGSAPVVQDELTGFRVERRSAIYESSAAGQVRTLRLDGVGSRALRLRVDLSDLTAEVLAARRLELVLDGGDVCFRRPLRCKVRGDAVRCR